MPMTVDELFAGIFALPAFPVVLVTVERNIMTAAAFHFYSFEPPCVMVGIRPENLTFKLIEEKREYGINIPTTGQLDIVRLCGSKSGRDVDKFLEAGVTPIKGAAIESFMIAECPVRLECQVVHKIDHLGSHTWFIGEILAARIARDYTRDMALMYWLTEYRSVGKVLHKSKS